MKLKPWYDVVKPREDLCQGTPIDAAQFAVHLDHVRTNDAPEVYVKPSLFFERTFLTKSLAGLAGEVIRRLSGETTETSAVFNMTTQFGGGKTHALTLLYHLAQGGNDAKRWMGVSNILEAARIPSIPKAHTAIFVGTEFDSTSGRGGNDGTPHRRTPWGEIAYQLGGDASFKLVAEHDRQFTEPKGDVIRAFLPKDEPCLILMDEIINYVSSYRKLGYHNSLYNFLQSLSETVRGMKNVVLVASLPKSELEYLPDDTNDEQRFKKMLDRVGKAIMMSAEEETSEIIRRRLFDWDESERDDNGKIWINKDATRTCEEYADWVKEHRQQVPAWFPVDDAKARFAATYPFHPCVLSVFERKWQSLEKFQRTRGVLRLLALWVSKNYEAANRRTHKDPLIGLGTAPLGDQVFRAAVFEQLGEDRLEGPVMTDVSGRKDSHTERLDKEATDAIGKGQLHKKSATTIFFESNGGQTRDDATLPEIRLAVGEPDLDIGNIETVLDSLLSNCYFLSPSGNNYRFSTSPNLNKLLSDRRASIKDDDIDKRVRAVVQKEFQKQESVDVHHLPSDVNPISDRPVLTLAVLAPDQLGETFEDTTRLIEKMTRESGGSSRTFKSAIVWCIPDSPINLHEEARRALAWESIEDNDIDRLDENQKRLLTKHIAEAPRNLKEAVWRSYRFLLFLGRDNTLKKVDLGFQNSSMAKTMVELILTRLIKDGQVEKWVNPEFLKRNWPPAFTEWSTKSVRDVFFASPMFPRLLNADSVKETIATGVTNGILAYVGKTSDGRYDPFHFEKSLSAAEVEICEDMYIVTAEVARKHIQPPTLTSIAVSPPSVVVRPGDTKQFIVSGLDQHGHPMVLEEIHWSATGGSIDMSGVFTAQDEGYNKVFASVGELSVAVPVQITATNEETPPPPPEGGEVSTLTWSGEIPPRKWTNFYSKVLSRFSADEGMKIRVNVEITQKDGITSQKIEETKSALRELGLEDDVAGV